MGNVKLINLKKKIKKQKVREEVLSTPINKKEIDRLLAICKEFPGTYNYFNEKVIKEKLRVRRYYKDNKKAWVKYNEKSQ